MRLLDPLQLTSTQKQFMFFLLGTYLYSLSIVVVSDSQYSIQELMVMKVEEIRMKEYLVINLLAYAKDITLLCEISAGGTTV